MVNKNKEIYMNFSDYRIQIGNQADLAKLLNLSQQCIAKYEKGKAYPRRKTLKKLAELFEISEGEVLAAIDNSKIDD